MTGKQPPKKGNSSREIPYPTEKPKRRPRRSQSPDNELGVAPTRPTSPKRNAKTIAAAAAFKSFVQQSEFTRIEELTPETTVGNLSNEIHPIYARKNFQVDNAAYAVLHPCLQLATLLLTHRSLKPMLRTILLHNDLKDLQEKDNDGKGLYAYTKEDSNLAATVSKQDLSHIDQALDELQHFVTFEPSADFGVGFAATQPSSSEVSPPPNTKLLQGLTSRTLYSAETASILAQLTNTPVQDVPALVAWRFMLAVEFAHEVAHALVYASDGRKEPFSDTETFFHQALVSEHGFSLEEMLFGGHVDFLWRVTAEFGEGVGHGVDVLAHRKAPVAVTEKKDEDEGMGGVETAPRRGEMSQFQGIVVLWEWPCRYVCESYQALDLALWVRKTGVTHAVPRKDVAWRVLVTDLAQFFTDEFWKDDRTGPRSLKFKKRVGQLFEGKRREGSKEYLPERSTLLDVEKKQKKYLPAGYRLAKPHGDFVRDSK